MTFAPRPSLAASLAASPDGQWVALRQQFELALLAGGRAPAVARVELGTDDADLALVGPPSMVAVVVRNVAPRVMLYQPPQLEVVARHDLDAPMRVAAITGPRIVLASADHKKLVIVRVAATALSAQTIDLDSPFEFVVGLEKNQILLCIQRKLEVWDAATGRPALRMQLPLPPPPRTVGTALGHLWVTRPNTDDILIYRLSDGRPFRHVVGATTLEVISHPASPLVVVATARGLVRLHCFAHSLTLLETPFTPGTPLAQLAVGDDVSLLGLPEGASEPWHIPLAGAGAPAIPRTPDDELAADEPVPMAARESTPAVIRFRSLRERAEDRAGAPVVSAMPAPVVTPILTPPSALTPALGVRALSGTGPQQALRNWREPIVAIGEALLAGGPAELSVPIADTELAELADRLLLSQKSIRALVALYALYLVGEPALPIARLAHVLGDWSEPLGHGELGLLGMLRRRRGRIALRSAVTDLLDDTAPRAVRLGGGAAGKPHAGAWRHARDGKSDLELEAQLAARCGRIAIVVGDPDRALLEARLHGATAVAFHPPDHRPEPWPRDAGLVLVRSAGEPGPTWIADLPALDAPG